MKKFLCKADEPVVRTKAGKLRGFLFNGTYTFYGVQYAQASRFQMPAPPDCWEGVKDAHCFGATAPLLQHPPAGGNELLGPHRYWPENECCQYLNIWTPGLDPQANKPVMVWIHGGVFSFGSSIEQVAYDGDSLSRFGDVVVVSLNHRLNILGYLDLSSFGSQYVNSGNAGMADIVEALRWIRENISGFGGDPGNVTIFGQSGGGAKVDALCQTPAADGLFHKAIIMSGVFDTTFGCVRDDRTIVLQMLRELGLASGDAEKLETLPWPQLAEAYRKAATALRGRNLQFMNVPIPNGWYAGDPVKAGFTAHAKTIPTMVGTAYTEFNGPGLPGRHSLPTSARREAVAEKYGAAAGGLIRLFKEAYPGKNEADLLALDTLFRKPALEYLDKRSAEAEAPVYSYVFALEFDYEDGLPAWHGADIPYAFHNAGRVPICNFDGVSDMLEEQVCGAFVSFARTGDPENAALPHWAPYTPGNPGTMVFDRKSEVRIGYDAKLIDLLAKIAPPVQPRDDM